MKKFFVVLMTVAGVIACSKTPDNSGNVKPGGGGETPDPSVPASLQGSAYYPIILDEESAGTIAGKIVCDLRPDDVTKHLYIWTGGETYAAGEGAGTNFYGNTGGYLDLVVTNAGWSGAGYNGSADAPNIAKLANIAAEPANYYIHFAYKGAAGVAHMLHFYGTDEKSYDVVVGEGSVVIDDVAHKPNLTPLSGAFVADEWNEYEISVQDAGVNFAPAYPAGGLNYLTFLSGGVSGHELKLDAVFIYKK